MDDLLASILGLGTYAEPPVSVPVRILGLSELPSSQAQIQAAFRDRVRQFHPDVLALNLDRMMPGSDELAAAPVTIQEMTWARDVLLRKVPKPVTGDKLHSGDIISRNGRSGRCEECGSRLRWQNRCPRCETLQRQRARRLAARSNRLCPGCGATFTPLRADGIYCTPACRQRAYRNRR